jgi:hypothetical protein
MLGEYPAHAPQKSGGMVRPHSVFVKGQRGNNLPGGAEFAISTEMEYK